MKRINLGNMPHAEVILYGAAAVAGLYLLVQLVGTVKKVAGAAGDAAATVGSGANTVVTGVASGLGSIVGLPTPGETIDDPKQVRWIMDNVGHLEASTHGTASAWIKALSLAHGSGTRPTGWSQATANKSMVADEVVSSRGQAELADPDNRSFTQAQTYDPFSPSNYSTGSIYDIQP